MRPRRGCPRWPPSFRSATADKSVSRVIIGPARGRSPYGCKPSRSPGRRGLSRVASTTSRPPLTPVRPPASAQRFGGIYAFLTRHSNWVAAGIFSVLSLAIYGPAVTRTGFYYDDWALQAGFHDASHSLSGLWHECRGGETAGRPGGCVYHVTTYFLLGSHPSRYHAMAVVFLAASTFALFLLLRACRLPWLAAVATGALLIAFPASDATRLWPTAVGAMLILGFYFVGVLIAIRALKMPWGRGAA